MIRRFLSAALLALLPVAPLRATWSIVVVNTRTGEVAVACATCVPGEVLSILVPVIHPGFGAGAAQSFVGPVSLRERIYNQLERGIDPLDILENLRRRDPGHESRQYGIVDILGRAATFTGTGAGAFADGLTGRVGDLAYAIQGNVITGMPVLTAAEAALLQTPGDLAEKLMVAMEAAKAMGGDGRCSCLSGPPPSCGSPPPNVSHTSFISFLFVARRGNTPVPCDLARGCATGTYWAKLELVANRSTTLDGVVGLRTLYDAWRQGLDGVVDQIESSWAANRTTLPADRFSRSRVVVQLRDHRGNDVVDPNLGLTVRHTADSAGLSTPTTPVHLGGGSWEFSVQAPGQPGLDRFDIVVPYSPAEVYLAEPLELNWQAVPALRASSTSLSASAGETLLLQLDGGLPNAQREYVLLLGLSGATPPTPVAPGLELPLVFDTATQVGLELVNTPFFLNAWGRLANDGRSLSALAPLPGTFRDIVGLELHFAWCTLFPIDFASNGVSVRITP